MKSEKILKYMSLTILAVIILSIIPATTTLALSTGKHPIAQQVSMKTSRDAWGTVWKNMNFYVDVVSYSDASAGAENISIMVTVGSSSWIINATRVGLTPTYRANFTIDAEGILNWTSVNNVNTTLTELSEDDVIEFSYGAVTKSLTFKHTPATAEIRTTLPYHVYNVGTLDWSITAPDLNKDPYSEDSIEVNITVIDYTTGMTFPLVGVPFTETGVNTGEFEPVPTTTGLIKNAGPSRKNDTAVNQTAILENGNIIEGDEANLGPINVTFTNYTTYNVTTVKIEWINITGGIIYDYCNISDMNFSVLHVYTINNISNATAYTVSYEIPIPNTGATFSIEYNITIESNGTHYNVSIDALNLSTNILGEYILYAAGVPIDVNEDADVVISVPEYTGSSDVDTVTIAVSVFRYVGEVSGTATIKDGLTITVTDLAANYKTYAAEERTVDVYVPDTATSPNTSVTLTETDDDTGVFEGSLSIIDFLNDNLINGSYNKIKVSYVDTNNATRNATIGVTYYTASIIEVTPESIVFGKSIVEITIDDPDLNLDPDVRDSYSDTLQDGDPAVLDIVPPGYSFKLANISLYAVLSNGTEVLLTTNATSVPISLTETGADTGTFVVRFDLRRFNVTGIGTETVEKLKIVYMDLFTPDLEAKEVTAELPAAVPSITVDRSEIPLTRFGSGPVVHITLIDQEADTNSYTIDQASVGIYLEYANGTIVELEDSHTLTETDVNTGEFTGSYTIPLSYIKPALLYGKLLINYTTPESGTYLEKEVPFRVYPVKLEVNGTSSLTVKYGDVVEITVESNDFNLDASEAENWTVSDLGIEGLPDSFNNLEFEETGEDTGVFKATFTVDGTFADPATSVTISISDDTPTYATVDMTDWPPAESDEVTIYVKAFTGELTVDKTVCGPVGKVTLTVADPDQNSDLEAEDNVTITIQKWDGTFMDVTAFETDVDTGVFEYELDISDLGTPDEVIGNKIRVIYRDPVAADGKPLMSIVEISFISWDPEITTDKNYYNIGDKIKITITDSDANKNPDIIDPIRVRVTSTSDAVGATVTLSETGPDTGVFTGEVLLSDTIGPGRVYVKLGDVVTISYIDEFPADYGVTSEEKEFTYTVRVGIPVEKPIVPSTARFVDPMTGEEITPKVGRTVGIGITLSNTGIEKTAFTVLLVIRDATGAAVGIQWQTVTLPAGESGEAGFTFTPTATGDYTVEVYIIKSLADWTPLGEMLTTTMSVTE